MFAPGFHWYLLKTNPRKEKWVCEQISRFAFEVFSPIHRTGQKRGDRKVPTLQPLFPTYVFAECELDRQFFEITHTPGVRGFISAGTEPLIVSEQVIAELKRRCPGGVAEIGQQWQEPSRTVEIVSGPVRGLSGIFDQYRSAGQRVIMMLELIRTYAVHVCGSRIHQKR
jgi:transcriptional antiterminator RfaH